MAFTNYVPVIAGIGARQRSSRAGWKQAEDEWPAFIERLRLSVIIMLG